LRTSVPAEYLCYLLDSYGQIIWRQKLAASCDDEAITTARTFLRGRIDSTSSFELWQGRQYICCENDAVLMELEAISASKLAVLRAL
jgi:hypothetical protein